MPRSLIDRMKVEHSRIVHPALRQSIRGDNGDDAVRQSRRNLLVLGGIVGAIYGLRALPWNQLLGHRLDYAAIEGVPPFRTLEAGGLASTVSAAFIGLDPPDGTAEVRRARADAVRADLCGALFGADVLPGTVPIAYFSEFRCPNCRALERDLDPILAANPDTLRLVQHELPIFGPPSELAARASVAAALQGLQQPLRRRLMRSSLVADERSILAVAATVGLDTAQLAHDMNSPKVQAKLDQTRALADVFGFFGTPGLVIGRTVLTGAVPASLLRRVVADELSVAPLLAC